MINPVLIFDCHGIGHECKHSFGELSSDGIPTGVIYGFLLRILNMTEKFGTDNIVFAWDSGKSKRKEIYEGYKKRAMTFTPEEEQAHKNAIYQFQMLRRKILPHLGFLNNFICTGYEADDVIASVVHNNPGYDFIICSSDKDLYQLLNYASIWKNKTKQLYTREELKKEYECFPEEWIVVKALAGCPGDTVPGIRGIGEKTVIKWIRGELKGKKEELLRFVSKDLVERNRLLVELPHPGTPVFEIKDQTKLKLLNILMLCEKYGMNSLIKGKNLEQWKKLSGIL